MDMRKFYHLLIFSTVFAIVSSAQEPDGSVKLFTRTTVGAINIYKAYFDDKKRIKIDENDIWNSKIDFSFSESELKEQILGCRKGEELQNFGSLEYIMKFKRKMSEYLSDCTEISKKIANKEEGYVYGNLEKIIAEYNFWYLKSHKK